MPRKQPTYIYFIRREDDIGPIKIGSTRNIKDRLSGIQTGNPYKLKIIKTIYGERWLEVEYHKKFDNLRLTGEWFKPEKRLLDFILNVEEDKLYTNARKYFKNKNIKIIDLNQFLLLDEKVVYYPLTGEWQNYTHNKTWRNSLSLKHFYSTYFNPSKKEIERQSILMEEKKTRKHWYNEDIGKIYQIARNCEIKPEKVIKIILGKERATNELTKKEIFYILSKKLIVYKKHLPVIRKKLKNKTLEISENTLLQNIFRQG